MTDSRGLDYFRAAILIAIDRKTGEVTSVTEDGLPGSGKATEVNTENGGALSGKHLDVAL